MDEGKSPIRINRFRAIRPPAEAQSHRQGAATAKGHALTPQPLTAAAS
jgi:hypothetical protein